MEQAIFDSHNDFLKKHYGKIASQETFNKFVQYCKSGVQQNGIKPVLNPINLYAFGFGISSEKATELLFLKEKNNDRNI